MKTYRIDNRNFNIGDTITPQKLYQKKLDENKLLVEKILEKHRPIGKPSRDSILMLFEKFEHAYNYWTIQSNSNFYKTQIDENDILHIGDFNKVEELYKNLIDDNRANQIAIEYWNGVMTDTPKKEILVNTAIAIEIKSNSESERKNAFALRAGLGNSSIRKITDN